MELIGSVIPLDVSLSLPGGLHMEDVDFSVEFYTSPRLKVTFDKADMTRTDADNYVALLDTSQLDRGRLRAQITVLIPEDRIAVGATRPERIRIEDILTLDVAD